jgi:membrane-associated phospholipid phosphatase
MPAVSKRKSAKYYYRMRLAVVALSIVLPVHSQERKLDRWTGAFQEVLRDHKGIWTAPLRADKEDAAWLLPLGAAVALIPSDFRLNESLPNTPDQINFFKKVSHAGDHRVLAGAAGAFLLAGKLTGNGRVQETGWIAAQAVLHSHAVAQLLKFAAGRERPDSGPGRGRFWNGEQSFPSGHATTTWAVATVISHQYRDRPLVRFGVYALPVVVSAARFGARRHFPSDLVAGAAIGHLIGRYLFNRHHGPLGAPRGRTFTPVIGSSPRWGGIVFGIASSR